LPAPPCFWSSGPISRTWTTDLRVVSDKQLEKETMVGILWIILIIVLVLVLVGALGRGRGRW
jgi:hypothetical protein